MKRILVVLGLVGALGMVFGTVPAGAAPTNDVTVTLSCDKGVTATVSVMWVTNHDGGAGIFDLTCDVRRQSSPVQFPETAFRVTKFDVSTSPLGCADPGIDVPIGSKVDCPLDGRGARVTVR